MPWQVVLLIGSKQVHGGGRAFGVSVLTGLNAQRFQEEEAA